MNSLWPMFTTTIGSAAVISALAMLFFSLRSRSELHRKNKTAHRFLLAVVFGVFSIYASASAVEVDGALCNCRNLAPLYAGLVGGPVAGIGAALIGGLFRYFVYGGASAMPCMLACFCAGIIGSLLHLFVKKPARYSLVTGLCGSVLTEGLHMLLLCLFGLSSVAAKIWLPILLANMCGMAFCLFMYKRVSANRTASEETV